MSRSLSLAPPSSRAPSAFTLEEGLWFGDFDDEGAREAARASMAAMAGRVMGARPFPEAAQKLVQLTREDDADFNKVVRVLEMDPGLSQRVLRLVNSAGYGLRIRCTSISHAAALLGQLKLRQIATSAVLFDHFGKPSALTRRKQEHGSLVASLCRYLAIHLGLPQDDLFTIGLLHDLGQLMMLDDGDREYAALIESHDDGFDTLHLAERELLGFDHAVLAGQVLASWSIPSPVPEVISLHHQPALAHQKSLEIAAMVQTLRFADQMAHLLEAGEKRRGPARLAESEAASYLDFSEAQISAMWRDLEKVHEATKNRRLNILDIAPRSVDVPRSLAPRDRGFSVPPSRRPDSLAPSRIPTYSELAPAFSEPPAPVRIEAPRALEREVEREPEPEPEPEPFVLHPIPRADALPRVFSMAPQALEPEIRERPATPPPEPRVTFPPSVRPPAALEADPSPEVFPCSICYGPTFGARCPACGAHVCSAHQTRGSWCEACEDEFQEHRREHPFNGLFRLFGGVSLGVSFLATWFFATLSAAFTIVGLGLILGFGIYVAYQAILKIRFQQNSHLRAALRDPNRPSAIGLPRPLLASLRPKRPDEETSIFEDLAHLDEEPVSPRSGSPTSAPSENIEDAPRSSAAGTSSAPSKSSARPNEDTLAREDASSSRDAPFSFSPRSTRSFSSPPEEGRLDSPPPSLVDPIPRRRIEPVGGLLPGVPSVPPEPVLIEHNRDEEPGALGLATGSGPSVPEGARSSDREPEPSPPLERPGSGTWRANPAPEHSPHRHRVEAQEPPRSTAGPEPSVPPPSKTEEAPPVDTSDSPASRAPEFGTTPGTSPDEESTASAASESSENPTSDRESASSLPPRTPRSSGMPEESTTVLEAISPARSEEPPASSGAGTDEPTSGPSRSESPSPTPPESSREDLALEEPPSSAGVAALSTRLPSVVPEAAEAAEEDGPASSTKERSTTEEDLPVLAGLEVPHCEPAPVAARITPPVVDRAPLCSGAVGTVRIVGSLERRREAAS